MNNRAGPRKIVWAVDAFDDPERLRAQVPVGVKALAKNQPVEVLPVYVLTPGQINLSVEIGGPWIEQYRPAAERALEHALAGVDLPGLAEPEVLVESFASTTQSAKALAGYALGIGADLILVCSHGRKGVSRFFLGSFAESLLNHSKVPVMLFRPETKVPSEIRTVLVPTQFGPRSKSVFRRIVSNVREMGGKIVLFHAVPHPIEPILQSGAYLMGGSWIPVQSYFSQESTRHQRRAQGWARWARNQGVEVDVIVDTQGGPIGESIVYLAGSRNADLIAMETRTGPVVSALIGSVTRYVIHHADRPVWVLHSYAKASERERGHRRAA